MTEQRVSFGTRAPRVVAEPVVQLDHIVATSQAIGLPGQAGTDGPLFLGRDTHAVRAGVRGRAGGVRRQRRGAGRRAGHVHPTPAVSHAILRHTAGRTDGLADGVVVTSVAQPTLGRRLKYNPPDGGPADTDVTGWIQDRANELLGAGLRRPPGQLRPGPGGRHHRQVRLRRRVRLRPRRRARPRRGPLGRDPDRGRPARRARCRTGANRLATASTSPWSTRSSTRPGGS